MIRLNLSIILFSFLFLSGCSDAPKQANPKTMSWPEIEAAAYGTSVNMLAWMGDAATNKYLENFIAPALKEKYGIDINFSSVAGPRIISFIMAEREANKEKSEADLVWMAGRQSHQMRQLGALYGPFVSMLPNSEYIDYDNRFINKNYEIPLDGMEVPWGQGQFLLISDSARVPNPPRNMAALEGWVKDNPGRFTIDPGFTTLAFLKALLVEIAGDRDVFTGEFKEALYLEHSQKLWIYLNRIRPYMWRRGEAFARNPAQMHQMFANGEIDFSMSYNNSEADKRIAQGIFPASAFGFIWDTGTPKNATYLSIINNSKNIAGAMVTINYLISPEAQLKKLSLDSMGDGSVLSTELLPQEWQVRFKTAQVRKYSPSQIEGEKHAFVELRPEYITRLYNDFIKNFINASP